MKNKEGHKELSEIAPCLSKLGKEENYVIPEKYFDKVSDVVWSKIELDNKEENNSNVKTLARRILAVAASLVIILFVVKGLDTDLQTTEEIPVDAIVEFVMEDVSDLDEAFISELHDEAFDLAETEDATFDFILEEGLEDIDVQFLQTLY